MSRESYIVSAYNTAKQSENKMHDDTVAQRFGFSGGLVPGVDVMAYMMHMPVVRWGRPFLERGLIEARFVKPVYDGETATVTSAETNSGMSIEVQSRGEVCATGSASLPSTAPRVVSSDYKETAPVAERHPVDASSYARDKWLGTDVRSWPPEDAAGYLADVRENDPIFMREGLVHPGVLQRIMNKVLVDNAILGPWIHVGSRMQLLSAAEIGDALVARARVVDNYDKKGHRFVELDAIIVANGETPVAQCHHIAITQPREQRAA